MCSSQGRKGIQFASSFPYIAMKYSKPIFPHKQIYGRIYIIKDTLKPASKIFAYV